MNSQSIKRKVVWYGLLLLFFAGFLSFVIGFCNALSIGITMTQSSEPVSQESSDPSAEKHDDKTFPSEGVQIMALGDSLARGPWCSRNRPLRIGSRPIWIICNW